ncbi:MAG: MFS transporter [Promethearchaeota archaeon]
MIRLEAPEEIKDIKRKSIGKLNKKYQSNIKKIYLYQFLMGFYLISGVLIPFFLTWGQLNIFEFNLLQGYYFIMAFLLEIPCGMIGDHISRKKMLFLAGLISSIAALIYGLIPNIFMFYIGETLFALGDALFSGTIEGLIYGSLKTQGQEKKFSKILGKSKSVFLLGVVISSPLGSIIGYKFSLQFVMILMFIPYIGCTIISLTFKEPPHVKKKKSSRAFNTIKLSFKLFKENKTIKILLIDMLVIEILILVLSLIINIIFIQN